MPLNLLEPDWKLIWHLKVCDSIEKKIKFSDGFSREKYWHMSRYQITFLQELGISFSRYIGKESKQLEYRDLTGPEKVKLFQNINISFLLPNSEDANTIQKNLVWLLGY